MSEWVKTTLGNVLTFQRGFDITRLAQKEGDVPVISSGGISSFHDVAAVEGPGVVIGRKGTLGKTFYVEVPYWPHDTTLWVKDFKGNVPKFAYYFMRQLDTAWLDAGSANPTLNRNHLHPLQVSWPPVVEQVAIAEVLGALDDKIAANRKLSEVADACVREAFAQCCNQATEVLRLDELAANIREAVSPDSLDSDELYVGLEHVPRKLVWLSEWESASSVGSSKNRFRRGDILFGKLRPYFHKVVSAPISGVCSTDILVLRPRNDSLAGFVMAAASSDPVVARATETSEGTRMPRTKWTDLSSVSVAWPGEPTAQQFSAEVVALRDAVDAKNRENNTLSALRDTLLPRLMSGELRVRDVERVVAGVV